MEALQESLPRVVPPAGPPPKRLVVKDIKKGHGRSASEGDQLGIRYVGVDYETGAGLYRRWNLHPLTFRLGSGYLAAGLERGLRGMKAGGLRELILPPNLAYGGGVTVDYVVQLASLRRGQ